MIDFTKSKWGMLLDGKIVPFDGRALVITIMPRKRWIEVEENKAPEGVKPTGALQGG